MKSMNILIVGVGGQGTLLASKFLGAAAGFAGSDVKVSEVHGMSQRGGSVVTCVKMGEDIKSPIIEKGEADVILSFEQVEAVRWLSYLKPNGTVITNTQKINPMTVVSGKAVYPENVLPALEKADINLIALDALQMATECGTAKAVNVVLLGVLCRKLGEIDEKVWLDALDAVVPKKFAEMNKKAFYMGYNR